MTSSFLHISGVRLSGKASLGPKIGRVRRGGKPSDVDGDGDGFVTGVDGEDNIPAPKAFVDKLTSLDDLRSWLGGRGESGFSDDDLKVFNLNVNSAEFERNRGRQRVANVLRDRWFYLERDSVRPQDEESFDGLVEQEQERQRWLIGRLVDRAERVGDVDGLKDDIESRNILKDLLASDAALKALKDSESDFRKFDDQIDEFKAARKQRVDEIRNAATIVGDDVKREAERRVDAVLAGRKNILRDYVVARYGKSNAPWLKMTDAKRRELARFADEGDRESRDQLLDWADAMFSHDLIPGTNGKNYRVEVAETEYYDGEIRVSFQVFQEGSDRRVGYGFRRMSFIDSDAPEFENEEFFMDDGHKNAGIGTIINQHAFMYAKAAGFDSVFVKAARDGVFVWGKTGFREKIYKFKLKKMSKEVDAFYSGEKSIITNADDAAIILDLIEQAEKSVSRSETPRHLDFIVALSNVFPKDSDEYKKRNQEIAGWFIDNMPFSDGNFYFDENGVVADPRVVSDNKTKSLSFLDLSSLRLVKGLGPTIGGKPRVGKPSEVDGDGDGFVTGADGEDNVPAPLPKIFEKWKNASRNTLEAWFNERTNEDGVGFSDSDLADIGISREDFDNFVERGRKDADKILERAREIVSAPPYGIPDAKLNRQDVSDMRMRVWQILSRREKKTIDQHSFFVEKNPESARQIQEEVQKFQAEFLQFFQAYGAAMRVREQQDEWNDLEKRLLKTIRDLQDKESVDAENVLANLDPKIRAEADRRVKNIMEKRARLFGKYILDRYGEDDSPWLDMTPERRIQLAKAARGGDADAKRALENWARDMYSHDEIVGANGEKYRITAQADYSINSDDLTIITKIWHVDSNGDEKEIGKSDRVLISMSRDVPQLYNSTLFIEEEEHKGQGIAGIYNSHAFMYAKAAGFTEASTSAADDGPYVWARLGYRGDISQENIDTIKDHLREFDEGKGDLIRSKEDAEIIRYLVAEWVKNNKGKDSPRHIDFVMALSNTERPGSMAWDRRQNQIKNFFLDEFPFDSGVFVFDENMILSDPRKLINETSAKALNILAGFGLISTKALGRNLTAITRAGGTSEVDGDGDGFVTGPDGQDNVPAPIGAGLASFATPQELFDWLDGVDVTNMSDADFARVGIDPVSHDNALKFGSQRAEAVVPGYEQYADSVTPDEVDDFNRNWLDDARSRFYYEEENAKSRLRNRIFEYRRALDDGDEFSMRVAQNFILEDVAKIAESRAARKKMDELQPELDDITQRLKDKFDADISARELWREKNRESVNIAGKDNLEIAQKRIQETVDKRQRIIADYVTARYGRDNAPWLEMTPERRETLLQTEEGREEIKAWAEAMYSHESIMGKDGNEYRVTAEAQVLDDGKVLINCRITSRNPKGEADIFTDDEWEFAGWAERTIYNVGGKEPYVYNQNFFMNDDKKGAGIGTIFNQHAFMYAHAAGFTHADTAAAADGPYIWARTGYRDKAGIREEEINIISRELKKFDESKGSIIKSAQDAEIVRALLVKHEDSPDDIRHLDFIMAMANTPETDLKNFFLDNGMGVKNSKFVFSENGITADPRKLINETSQKALNILAGFGLISTKALGSTLGRARRVGQVSEVDGDGDGFITGHDGEDNVPAPKQLARKYVAPNMTEVFRYSNYLFNNELSDDEQDSIGDYVEGGYGDINGYFRRGSRDEDIVKVAKTFDDAFNKASIVLGNDETVYRGMSLSEDSKTRRWIQKLEVGDEFKDMGFVSTSSEKSQADIFANRREVASVMFVIKTPKGTEVIVGNRDESEIILRRGSQFVVTKIDKTVRGGKESYKMEMELLL